MGVHTGERVFGDFDRVRVYAKGTNDERDELRATSRDPDALKTIADTLHRQGYGVMRSSSQHAGPRTYALKAQWIHPGDPPKAPLGPG